MPTSLGDSGARELATSASEIICTVKHIISLILSALCNKSPFLYTSILRISLKPSLLGQGTFSGFEGRTQRADSRITAAGYLLASSALVPKENYLST